MFGMWIWWVLLIAVIVGVAWFAKDTSSKGGASDSPEEILKRRFANGEIDEEEFERRLTELRK